MKNIVKRITFFVLLISFFIGRSVHCAAAAHEEKIDVSRISIQICRASDALLKEKNAFVSGMNVVEPGVAHDAIFNTFKLSFSVGLIMCASIVVDGQVAGVMFYSQDEDNLKTYELDYLVVAKDFQRKGIGARAVDLLAQTTKAETIKLKPRPGSEIFYQKIGFKLNRTGYYVKNF